MAREDFFLWQNFQNPAESSILRVAAQNGEIIGRSAFVPKCFWSGSDQTVILEWVDSITHPEHRGKGVFTSLAQALQEAAHQGQFAVSYAMAYPKIHRLCTQQLGYLDGHVLPLWVCVLNSKRLLQNRNFPAWLAGPLGKILETYPRLWNGKYSPQGTLREAGDFDDRFDAFWEKMKGAHQNLLVRDQRYLRWRYKEIPGREYRIVVAQKEGTIEGFCVYRLADFSGLKLGLITDLLTPPGHRGIVLAKDMISYAVGFFKDSQADIVLAYFSKCSTGYDAVFRTGFLRCPQRLSPKLSRVIYRLQDRVSTPANSLDLRNSYFTMGDFDFG